MTPHRLSQTAYALDPVYGTCQEPKQPDACALLSCWCEQATKQDLVIGKDIPSRAFAKFLSHIMIVEPMDSDTNGLIRLAGTALRLRYGTEASGKRLSEFYSSTILPQYLAYLRGVRDTGEPLILEASYLRDDALHFVSDEIVLRALAPDGVSMWNVVAVFLRNG